MRKVLLVAATTVWMTPAVGYAQEQIYRCSGRYTNQVSEAEAAALGCKLVSKPLPNAKLWRLVGVTNDADHYLEREIPRKDGAWLKVWFLISFGKEQKTYKGDSYFSTKQLLLFNCGARTYAMRQNVNYSDAIGESAVVTSMTVKTADLEFEDPVPSSIGEIKLKAVCNLK